MTKLYRRRLSGLSLCALFALTLHPVFSQTFTPQYNKIDANSHGYYEYLPAGYEENVNKYPVLIFLHGLGDLGNGRTDLPNVLRNGLPKLISEGNFPSSFTVNGQRFEMIIIAPQFNHIPSAEDVKDVVDYAVSNYRVNEDRIYLTGMSMGGGGVWDYTGSAASEANRLAAIVPVCGTNLLTTAGALYIGATNLPVWATHNQYDPTVLVGKTMTNIDLINSSANPPTPRAMMTIFPKIGHDAWTQTYDPEWRPNGLNIYEWMLQYTKEAAAAGALPVVLSSYNAYVSGEKQATIAWSTSYEKNNRQFLVEKSANGSDFAVIDSVTARGGSTGSSYTFIDDVPYDGVNYYRLVQQDADGTLTYFDILTVSFAGSSARFVITPNPAAHDIFIKLNNSQRGKIQVLLTDMSGRTLRALQYNKAQDNWQQTINITNLPPGQYLVRVIGDNIEEHKRFIKN